LITCYDYYYVQNGDTCYDIQDLYGDFTLSQFYTWNPYALYIILANGLDLLTVSPYIGPSPQAAQGLSLATMFAWCGVNFNHNFFFAILAPEDWNGSQL
jgi:hypothetical protein